jgi:lipopolysaccharide transport system permease protein
MTADIRVIERQRYVRFGIREALGRTELLLMLAQRQIASRYRQMLLGILWALLEPLGQLLLLTLVFGFLLKVDTAGFPYPLFAFTGLAAWWLFSRTLMAVAGCLQDNMTLISKVYFPRLVLAFASCVKELFDIALLIIPLLIVSAFYGRPPGVKALALVPLLLFASALGLGIGLWLASLMVRFRDIRPMLGLALQAGMYATPIVYSPALVPESIRFIYQMNPMYWITELSRWALLDKAVEITAPFYWSLGLSAAIIGGGLLIFSATEKMAVDVQ